MDFRHVSPNLACRSYLPTFTILHVRSYYSDIGGEKTWCASPLSHAIKDNFAYAVRWQAPRLVRCDCPKCGGKDVPRSTRNNHLQSIHRQASSLVAPAANPIARAVSSADFGSSHIAVPPPALGAHFLRFLQSGSHAHSTVLAQAPPLVHSSPLNHLQRQTQGIPPIPESCAPQFGAGTPIGDVLGTHSDPTPVGTPSCPTATRAPSHLPPGLPLDTSAHLHRDPLSSHTEPSPPSVQAVPALPCLSANAHVTAAAGRFHQSSHGEPIPPAAHDVPAATSTRRSASTNVPAASRARRSADAILADEQHGLEHMSRAMAAGLDLDPIADDDWEDDEDDPVDELDHSPDPAIEQSTDENNPDPFHVKGLKARPLRSSEDVHPSKLVYIWYLLVVWLHTQFHLPHRACNVLLAIAAIIMNSCGVLLDPNMRKTLPGAISALDADPDFVILPICPLCRDVCALTDDSCKACKVPLHKTQPTPAQRAQGKDTRSDRKPKVQFPYMPLEQQLRDAFAVPGLEDAVDDWRKKVRTEGIFEDIMDGRVCKEVKGPDGLPFFHHGLAEMPDGELRIGVTLGIDW